MERNDWLFKIMTVFIIMCMYVLRCAYYILHAFYTHSNNVEAARTTAAMICASISFINLHIHT